MKHLKVRYSLTEAGCLLAPGQRSGLIQQAFDNTLSRIEFHNQELLLTWLLSDISFRQVCDNVLMYMKASIRLNSDRYYQLPPPLLRSYLDHILPFGQE